MKYLTNNVFLSDCAVTKDNTNLSLFIALSKGINLASKADKQVYIIVHIPAAGD